MCPMPNLKPVPDSLAHLRPQLEAIARDSVIHTYPYGAITVGEQGGNAGRIGGDGSSCGGFF